MIAKKYNSCLVYIALFTRTYKKVISLVYVFVLFFFFH